MSKIDIQMTLADLEYTEFVEKFKPKKTTDDCYTPPNVYAAVLEWVRREYQISEDVPIIRPFWPGRDYLREDYPDDCVVIDNPPFSIISKICADYVAADIKFFLFAPYLTNFSTQTKGVCHVITSASIIYENGAEVSTAFVTNLDDAEIRSAPDLQKAVTEADAINRAKQKKQLPKYEYPPEVLTATMVGQFSRYGVPFSLKREQVRFIRALDSQRKKGKSLFGSGYLLSTKAAAEKAAAEKAAAEKAAAGKAAAEKAAEVWSLSRTERAIIEELDKHETGRSTK